MKKLLFPILAPLILGASVLHAQETLTVDGLDRPVEILKDKWGISHIYAETEHDLFFAQGYNAARDRLFNSKSGAPRLPARRRKSSAPELSPAIMAHGCSSFAVTWVRR